MLKISRIMPSAILITSPKVIRFCGKQDDQSNWHYENGYYVRTPRKRCN